MRLDDILKKKIKSTLDQYHKSLWMPPLLGEIDFVDRTVKSFDNFSFNNQHQFLKARSKKLHPKPKVIFFPYGPLFPNNRAIVEMGDLFFV